MRSWVNGTSLRQWLFLVAARFGRLDGIDWREHGLVRGGLVEPGGCREFLELAVGFGPVGKQLVARAQRLTIKALRLNQGAQLIEHSLRILRAGVGGTADFLRCRSLGDLATKCPRGKLRIAMNHRIGSNR